MKNVQLDGQTKSNMDTGSAVAGTTAAQLRVNARELKWGVQVVADSDNTNGVWVGYRPTLTADTDADTDGLKLPPGGTMMFPVSQEQDLYIVSDATDQNVTFFSF